ncbi:MAG: peptidoglycan DD-metalloendopeptidase family protein [Zoogloeaceae bacterium]|jgi:septal ring factor EnvC (AmiA/AmiB activator)|nr:peptidoglycan DD-metalloendopeptidase family protein [Zoogloeaceae bacterium]
MRILLFLLLSFCAAVSSAQGTGEIADKKEDLKELRGRIETLKKELSANEESRVDAADQLKQSEEHISAAQRQLLTLKQEHARLQGTLRELAKSARDLEGTLAQQQKQLERLLYRQYLQTAPDALQLALNGNDPNQLARDLYYLVIIARARGALLSEMRATLARQKKLAADAKDKEAELLAVRARQETEHANLVAQKAERKKILNQIAGKIKAQKQEIGNLQRDEKRLTQLIDRLTRLLAEQAKSAAKKKKDAEERARKSAGKNRIAGKLENRALPAAASGSFAKLKGKLRLPVRGQISGRFGAPREGGGVWKGLFIRAAQDSEVKAIAKGQVVYAEWMRGFGNLMIIDHGAGYLSVYGNNDALYLQVGDQVEGGDTVGAAGTSGGNADSGLYFELRHQGRALDPMQWVSLK